MATVYGVNRTLKNTGTVNTIAPAVNGAGVRWVFDTYEASALAIGSVIELFGINLPIGSQIVDWVIDHDDLQNSMTLAFGTNDDDDCLMTATTCGGSADKKNMTDDGVSSALGLEIDSADDQTLILTTGTGIATGTIKVGVCFVAPGTL